MKFRGSDKEWSAAEKKDVNLHAAGEIEGLAARTSKELKQRDLQARIDAGTYDPDAVAEAMNPSVVGIEAGFLRRGLAYILDNILINVIFVIGIQLLIYSGSSYYETLTSEGYLLVDFLLGKEQKSNMNFASVLSFVFTLSTFLYYPILLSGKKQATFGMRMLGLHISCIDGRPVGFWRAFARDVVFQIVLIVPFLGLFFGLPIIAFLFLVALNGFVIASLPTHQGIHDLAVRTLVLRKEVKSSGNGFAITGFGFVIIIYLIRIALAFID